MREILPMPNTRRQNRETFVRLFQGFVNEYGEASGKRIMKHIVDNAGGIRMDVPSSNPGLNQHVKLDNDPLHGCGVYFRRLWISTCKEFGHDSGHDIMNKIVCELGNQRVYFPCHKEINRWERKNEKPIQQGKKHQGAGPALGHERAAGAKYRGWGRVTLILKEIIAFIERTAQC
jgi:hypothetical protein